ANPSTPRIVRRVRRAAGGPRCVRRLVRGRQDADDVLRSHRADPQPGGQAVRGCFGLRRPDALRRQPAAGVDDHGRGQELARRPLLRAGRGLAERRREAGPAARAPGRHPRQGARALPVRGRQVGRHDRPLAGDRLRCKGQPVRPARLAAGAHRREVEGPRRLGAAQCVDAGLRHGAAARRGRGRREEMARGDGRQRHAGLRLEHPDPRRDRQGRARPRPDQPLLRRRGAGRGPRLPGQGPLPAQRPRLARQHRRRRRAGLDRQQGAGAEVRAPDALRRGAALLRRQLQGIPPRHGRPGTEGAHAAQRDPRTGHRPRQARRPAGHGEAHARDRGAV
ncbi:MAG: Ferric iron ABC transporter, iron-binding protein, partial [uncultured Solirubrobacteraceae bacterium]